MNDPISECIRLECYQTAEAMARVMSQDLENDLWRDRQRLAHEPERKPRPLAWVGGLEE